MKYKRAASRRNWIRRKTNSVLVAIIQTFFYAFIVNTVTIHIQYKLCPSSVVTYLWQIAYARCILSANNF